MARHLPVAPELVRTGSCNRCGACCSGDGTEVADVPQTEAGMCSLFRREPDGRGACFGWGWHPYYLNGCHVWPSKAEHVAPHVECSFRFEARA